MRTTSTTKPATPGGAIHRRIVSNHSETLLAGPVCAALSPDHRATLVAGA